MKRETRPLDQLLAEAIINGDDADFEALGDEGSIAVECFRAYLAGENHIQIPRVRDPRPYFDNMTALSCWLASRFPEPFLAAFNTSRWAEDTFVLSGLGYTLRAEAKPLLFQSLRGSTNAFVRMDAAISLGHLPGADTVAALMDSLEDDDYLVQYHSIRSLAQIGDRAALDRLLAIAADPPSRGIAIVAPQSATGLAQRLGVTVQIPSPDMSRWTQLKQRRVSGEDD